MKRSSSLFVIAITLMCLAALLFFEPIELCKAVRLISGALGIIFLVISGREMCREENQEKSERRRNKLQPQREKLPESEFSIICKRLDMLRFENLCNEIEAKK